MNEVSHEDKRIVDRLNAELSAIRVPARRPVSQRRSTSDPLPTLLVIAVVAVTITIGVLRFLRATPPTTSRRKSPARRPHSSVQ
jgi:hypothetical protein